MPYGDAALPDATDPADVRVRELSFAYVDDRDVLHGLTLDVAPGRTVAVVGPTGSGKSSLAGLLVRLVDPRTGEVLVDGVDVRRLARGEVAESAALVFQQAFVFEDSVRENVALGRLVSDEEVWAALRLAQADRFVRALPDGLDAVIGERGATLRRATTTAGTGPRARASPTAADHG